MDQVVKYDITTAAITKMSRMYMPLTISGVDDKEGFEKVHEARMVVKGKRVEVEKRRQENNKDALVWQRKNNAVAKDIFEKLEPIEAHLKAEENTVTEEKARIKAEEEQKEQERIQSRFDQLNKYNCSMPFYEVAAMSDEQFQTAIERAQTYYNEEQERKAKEEDDRKEKEEKERKERAAEAATLKAEREELEKARKKQAEEEAKLKADRERIELEIREAKKKVETDQKALEYERRKEAEEKARKKSEAEREARQEALGDEKNMGHEYIIEDREGDPVTAEIILYLDGEIEIGLSSDHQGLTYYCNVNDFETALKKAKAKLDI